MKIAIHHNKGSFSDRWIKYCNEEGIPFKIVNCYDSDIISQLHDCNGLMWHWNLNDYSAALFARQLTFSLEKKGIKVFPDVNTGWHYEDKVGQKYLLEAIDAPFVKSYVFYSKQDALKWVDTTSFPKVFKLRTGAASSNVRLVKNKYKAKLLVKKAFGSGFPFVSSFGRIKERFYQLKKNRDLSSLKLFFGGLGRLIIPSKIEKFAHREKGYIYFQDFIANNDYDTRLVVVGNRCFGARRLCRKGDFRASGSGIGLFDQKLIDSKMIKIAFDVVQKLGTQSLAFDFIYDNKIPKILELSYCYPMGKGSPDDCPGYWDSNLNWYSEKVDAQKYILEDFVKSLNFNRNKKINMSIFDIEQGNKELRQKNLLNELTITKSINNKL
jgi:glutathione synthase/RimK-type ligase-like ATP-grasp enzyme